MIITLITTKGGAGRSTIALNLSVAAAATGASVLLIDTDRQGAIRQAYERRLQLMNKPNFQHITVQYSLSHLLPDALPALKTRYDTIFIDTPADADYRIWKMIEASDLALVPIAAGYPDLELTLKVSESLTLIKANTGLVVGGVLNQWQEDTPISRTILRNLGRVSETLPLLTTRLHHHTEFSTAFSYGAGVMEISPESESSVEIAALYDEIASIIRRD